MTQGSRFDFRQGLRRFVLETLRPTQLSIYWLSEVKLPRHERNHSYLLPELRKLERNPSSPHIFIVLPFWGQFKESEFFPWDLSVVKISPEWVTGPEQRKSSGKIATFSLWTGVFSKLLEYKRKWTQYVNRMPRNRLPRVMKHYSTTGRRNHANATFEETSG